jgi:hypothetical protein
MVILLAMLEKSATLISVIVVRVQTSVIHIQIASSGFRIQTKLAICIPIVATFVPRPIQG